MKLPFFLLRRYLRFDKTQPFISITALLAFLGVGVGVMVLIVAMSIMNGVSKEFEKRLFIMNYPLTIYATTGSGVSEETLKALKAQFPALKFSPFLRYQAVLRANNAMNAGIIFGINLSDEIALNETLKNAVTDSNIVPSEFDSAAYPLLLSQNLKANFDIQERVTLFFTALEPSGFGLAPINRVFYPTGAFSSGLKAYDNAYFYTNLESLAKIRRLKNGVYDGIHVFSNAPMEDIIALEKFLESSGVAAGIEGWWQGNGNFFSAMEMEKRALFIVLLLIILMASLNIISSLLMVIMNRRKEVALLLSLGASSTEVKKTFFYLGNAIGLGGVILGVLLSFGAMWLLGNFPIVSLPADVYGSDKLPILLDPVDFFAAVFGAVLIVALSAWYPAQRAAKLNALEILRNE